MMSTLDLSYPAFLAHINRFVSSGQSESRALLAWFLENYYRLEDTDLLDHVCDGHDDKGVDGVYANDQLGQIDVFQAKLVRGPKSLGDTALKEFSGTLKQFASKKQVEQLIKTTKNTELAGLLHAEGVADKIREGYVVRGVFVTNATRDHNAVNFLSHNDSIVLYDGRELQRAYVPVNAAGPVKASLTLDIQSVPHLRYPISSQVEMVIVPMAATELLKMHGIENGELFSQNVRQWLRRTKVNKDIEKSIADQAEHKLFPAFHNGLTVLCDDIVVTASSLKLKNYAVVNGCQSLTTLHEQRASISSDLRLLTKFIRIKSDRALAAKITDHTNNQNGITHRDLQSNNPIQSRLQAEIHSQFGSSVHYRIKRGEHPEWRAETVIENELAARVLLAFDLEEPWACHQTYRLFDELHAEIFGRPEVDAHRIVAQVDLYKAVTERAAVMENRLFGIYGLTRFALMYMLRRALWSDVEGRTFCADPKPFVASSVQRKQFRNAITPLIDNLATILDKEITRRESTDPFDYKRELKSPKAVKDLASAVESMYGIVVSNGYAERFETLWSQAQRGPIRRGAKKK